MDQFSHVNDQQKWLEQNVLKMNYKSFTQIVILGSTNFVPFMQLTATHRREVIEDLLDIKIFSSMNNLIRDKIKGVKDEIRTQDTVSLLSLMSVNRNNGAEATWDFIKSNWALLDERYGSGGFAMMRLVGITGNLLTKSDYDNVQGFFNDHPIESAYRTLQQSLERIDANVAWLEHHSDEIESLLNSR